MLRLGRNIHLSCTPPGIGKPQNAAIKGAYAVSDTESIEVLGNVWRMPCMLGGYLNKTGVKEKSFKQTK